MVGVDILLFVQNSSGSLIKNKSVYNLLLRRFDKQNK